MIRIPLVLIAAGTLAASIAETVSAQQLVQRRDVSYAVALAIATGAVDACRALGLEIPPTLLARADEVIE